MKLGFSRLEKIECINKMVLSRMPKSLGRQKGHWKDDIKMNNKEIRALFRITSLGLHESSSYYNTVFI
jgi:hypothetical protein